MSVHKNFGKRFSSTPVTPPAVTGVLRRGENEGMRGDGQLPTGQSVSMGGNNNNNSDHAAQQLQQQQQLQQAQQQHAQQQQVRKCTCRVSVKARPFMCVIIYWLFLVCLFEF